MHLISLLLIGSGQHEGERLVTAESMHEWWCAEQTVVGRLETTPCLQHRFVQAHKAACGDARTDEESAECKRMDDEHERYMAQREDGERDDAQSREMHDSWCAMPDNVGTDFCNGWEEWKAKQDREL